MYSISIVDTVSICVYVMNENSNTHWYEWKMKREEERKRKRAKITEPCSISQPTTSSLWLWFCFFFLSGCKTIFVCTFCRWFHNECGWRVANDNDKKGKCIYQTETDTQTPNEYSYDTYFTYVKLRYVICEYQSLKHLCESSFWWLRLFWSLVLFANLDIM